MDVYESALHQAGFHLIAGADEAGRGACAGPLVAAAVILGETVPNGLDDSKKLTKNRRERLFGEISTTALAVSCVMVSAAECDAMGIQQADLRALREAVLALSPAPDFALTDGFAVPGLDCPSLGMWKGDQVVACVAAASIIAKVTRDRLMTDLDAKYPGYGFALHKGYVTPAHQAALAALGPCDEHRLTYSNVRRIQVRPESTDAARSERHSGGGTTPQSVLASLRYFARTPGMGVTDARRQTGRLLSVDGAVSVPPGGCAVAHDRCIQAKVDTL